jgi:glutamyl-Q tRNA(Asp) synthetase
MPDLPVSATNHYRGRFAPSPTGSLHMGSLVAAMASYLDARTHGGEWLLRVENLDPPREVPGSADEIIRTLELLGFEWDGEISWQSEHNEAYLAVLEQLLDSGAAFRCGCSRKDIATHSKHKGPEGPIYPGTCRNGISDDREPRSVRLRVDTGELCFDDRLQGRFCQNLEHEVGDFVILRADGYFAYQLAVVVDDAAQGITDVVRGADLLASTPRQVLLQQLLGLSTPRYLHIPLLLDASGQKLSKQSRSTPVDVAAPVASLWCAAQLLRLDPPAELRHDGLESFWEWALNNFNINKLKDISKL